MSYSDVMKAVGMHGDVLNKTVSDFSNKGNSIDNPYNSQGTNPWSSKAYTKGDYRSFAGGQPDIYDDRDMYRDMNDGMTDFDKTLMKGAKGMQGYKMGSMASSYISNANGFNLGPAGAVYSAFGNDNNPYTFTDTEKYGGTASNMMAGHQLSKLLPSTSKFAGGTALTLGSAALPMGVAAPALAAGVAGPVAAGGLSAGATAAAGINPYVLGASLLFSYFSNKGRKKKARRANEKVAREIGEEDTRLYKERSDKLEENRDDILAQAGSYQHGQDSSRYDNQYGGNYNNKYQYNDGGKMDVVAEFTGNELIVNEQDQVEQAIANGNYAAAAAPIRKAMANKQVTPGPETHKNNPMPVDTDGNIYAGGGKLNFKVNKGAGVYDHASDQFRPTMTDREIAMVVSKNMAKWESNNMA
jgi:hypothetical protein